jgi:hypothetical protein
MAISKSGEQFAGKEGQTPKIVPRAVLSPRRFLGTEGILFTVFKSQGGR